MVLGVLALESIIKKSKLYKKNIRFCLSKCSKFPLKHNAMEWLKMNKINNHRLKSTLRKQGAFFDTKNDRSEVVKLRIEREATP